MGFCEILEDMIADEKKAPGDYQKLKDAAISQLGSGDVAEVRRIISAIQDDEDRHHSTLLDIQWKHCRRG